MKEWEKSAGQGGNCKIGKNLEEDELGWGGVRGQG